jgi:hypothetical protein
VTTCAKRRHADVLVESKYCEFVSLNLDPGLPPRKLYGNPGGLTERLCNFFLTRLSLSSGIDFGVPVTG